MDRRSGPLLLELEAGGIIVAGQTEGANPDEAEGQAVAVAEGQAVAVAEVKTDDQHQLQEGPRPLLPTTD